MKQYQWTLSYKDVAPQSIEGIVDILLENRGLKKKEEKELFFHPRKPNDISLQELKIDEAQMKKALLRIGKAIENEEHIVVYGDYDADGVCATAILWQVLYSYTKSVTPFMPDRFIDGYGLHAESIKRLREKDPKLSLIITVDNGIVANSAVEKANELGIDVIVTDHHQIGKKLPKAHAIVHTDLICGSGVSWILGREICLQKPNTKCDITDQLDLAAIGTIADQMPLQGVNRSFAKYGLEKLNATKRCGLLAIFESVGVMRGTLGPYDVNYHIAPRINAMGRLENAMDSLRLLCTTNVAKAKELGATLTRINGERQKMVEEMVLHAKSEAAKKEWLGAIVLAHETYHEGVIGLIASKLVDEYYRPAIVLSKKGDMSKASARSIQGFNIIENIRKLDHLLAGGGGHPMAAGFSIESSKIESFVSEMEKLSSEILTEEMLQRKLIVDINLPFNNISKELILALEQFQPTGLGNMAPLFMTENVHIDDAVLVGSDKRHIKLALTAGNHTFDGIAFNFGEMYESLSPDSQIDIAYSAEMNNWNGKSTIQLKIKDIKIQ